MFQNNVLKPSVNTIEWAKAAAVRAGKTAAQTALSMLTIGQAVTEINWVNVASVSAVAALISFLTSAAGIPEIKESEV